MCNKYWFTKFKLLLMAFFLFVAMLPLNIYADMSEEYFRVKTISTYKVQGGNIYFEEDSQSIIAADDSVTQIDIPSKINGKTVKKIDTSFENCAALQTLSIPETVTELYYDIPYVQKFIVDKNNPQFSSVDGVLFNKEKTVLLAYPKGRTAEIYTIPGSVRIIGKSSFESVLNIKQVYLEEGIKEIQDYAFQECNALEHIIIPQSVTVVGKEVFFGCHNLEKFDIAEGSTVYSVIDDVLFSADKTKMIRYSTGKADLTYNVPDGVTTIEKGAFLNAKRLETVNISSTVESLGAVFYDCPRLKVVNISSKNTKVPINAYYDEFINCSSLEEINVLDSNSGGNISSIDGVLFSGGGSSLLKYPSAKVGINYVIPNKVTYIAPAFQDCKYLEQVTISKNVTEISADAFKNCMKLQKIILDTNYEDGVYENIGISRVFFRNCPNLREFAVGANCTEFAVKEGVLFDKDGVRLVKYPTGKNLETYDIPQGTTQICSQAFRWNPYLKQVNCPNSLKGISTQAFTNCEALQSVNLNQNLEYMDLEIFNHCANLQTVNLPESLQKVGGWTFRNCESLENIKIPKTVKMIDTYGFGGCKRLKTIDLPSGLEKISIGGFYGCEMLSEIMIPESVERIDVEAFSRCTSLKKVTILSRDVEICDKAFFLCPDLVIYGYKGSSAESFAKKQGIDFLALPEKEKPIIQQKKNQTIMARNFTKTYGNKPFSLGAKAKTKLSYKSSNTKVAAIGNTGRVTLKGPGKATITITAAATANYNGATKHVTITVKPKKTVGLKVKKGKNRMTVSWKRDKKATGYQITYAQNKKFKKGKKNITISKNKTVKRTIKKLKARKTYYVKVRAYKKVGKTKLYGGYSVVKRVKVR